MTASVFRSLDEARGQFGPCALSIGNFDGVHIGHQALLRRANEFVRASASGSERRLVAAALTFHPHPAVIVAPQRVPPMICTLEKRIRLLEAAGAEKILVLPFTSEVSRLGPREFVSEILVGALGVKAVLVGENFHFGYRQAGTPETLRELGREFGFVSQFVQPVMSRAEVVSSSAIRRYLAAGNVSRAGRLLGRCFSIEGAVVRGHGVGSTQTVPTLNLRPAPEQLVPRGVYISETRERSTGQRWPSITNAGVRPTFGGDELTVESFLLTNLERAAPEQIEVEFRHFVREERQFRDPAALKAQILRDVARAQAYWRRVRKLAPSLQ